MRIPRLFLACFIFLLYALPTFAYAATEADVVEKPSPTLALPADQVWTLVIGFLVPGFTYLLNKYAPWVSDQVKGIVHAVVAAVAGGLYQALNGGDIGFNGTTAQYVLTAVVAAFGAHAWFWKPSGLAATLGAGQNVQIEHALGGARR